MTYENILFDLDGTLTDSGPGIRHAVRHALLKYGVVETDEKKLNRFIGPPLYDSFMRFYDISAEEAAKGENYFREYYRDKGIFENSLYNGIAECLEVLSAKRHKLFIATSKPLFMAKKVLGIFEISRFFAKVYGADIENGLSAKKDVIALLLSENPDLTPKNTVMVGDREHDVHGAAENDLSCIGVLWGYGSEKELVDAGAAAVASTPAELLNIIG